jgi:hypothetical protein
MPPSLVDRFRRRSAAQPAEDEFDGALPTFVIIGAMKGGTSSLHGYLREHPQVCMSKKKETDFFFRPADHDLAWYRSQFREPADQYGESSPNYTKRHLVDGVAQRMHDLLPDARLIFLARDPIERAVSHFLHNVDKGRVGHDEFESYFDDLDNQALQTSRYHWQIAPFVETYGLNRILVLASERLRDDRADTIAEVFRFLDVDPAFSSPEFNVERHLTSSKSGPDGELLDRPVLSPRQHEAIADHLRPDIDQFRALVGQDFAHWSV